jgi:hypothetical protein
MLFAGVKVTVMQTTMALLALSLALFAICLNGWWS